MIPQLNHTKVFYEIAKSKDYRYVINEGGTRSSKTWSLLSYFLLVCLYNPNKRLTIQVFRKTLTSCHRTVMRDFIEILDTWECFNLVKYNKSSSIFTINGNTIEFCGADQAQKLRGSKRDILWINEANELTEEDFKQLKLRTSIQIHFDYNPSFTDSWIYDTIEKESGYKSAKIMDICKENNGVFQANNVRLIQSTYKDNTQLELSIIQEIENLKKYDMNDYQIYALGIRSNPSGLMFKRHCYQTYQNLPNHTIGVVYVDPNLSKKSKGDTTAICKLLYSPETNYFYVSDFICHSFSDSNELLKSALSLMDSRTKYLAFDGNVSQGSSWQQHAENYAKLNGLPYPLIDFKSYRVDEISKTTQYLWNDKQIFFNPLIEHSEDGERALNQIYMFNGKKNTVKGMQDDAPDALICAINYMYELNFVVNQTTKNLASLFFKK